MSQFRIFRTTLGIDTTSDQDITSLKEGGRGHNTLTNQIHRSGAGIGSFIVNLNTFQGNRNSILFTTVNTDFIARKYGKTRAIPKSIHVMHTTPSLSRNCKLEDSGPTTSIWKGTPRLGLTTNLPNIPIDILNGRSASHTANALKLIIGDNMNETGIEI